MAEHDGHRERMRQRVRETDMRGFQPHEVLEFLLMYAIPRRDVNPLAHKLIKHFGSLSGVLDARPEELMQVPGVGENAATLLSSLVSVFSAYQRDRWRKRPCLSSRKEAGEFCTALFSRQKVESIVIVCLDVHKAVLASEMLTQGTVSETPLYPREVVAYALRHQAHSVILAHNHPSGDTRPSMDDLRITLEIRDALRTMDITLEDHFIIAGSRFTSLWQTGALSEPAAVPLLAQEKQGRAAADDDAPNAQEGPRA